LIIIGLLANTCLEATARFAAELGYDVIVVKNATASFTDEQMHVALDINLPNYASAIVTTREIADAIKPALAGPSESLTDAGPSIPPTFPPWPVITRRAVP
jgi:isochorismate hydrolase